MPSDEASLQFLATGIGSVPFVDIEFTIRAIVNLFPRIPYWPQFVNRSSLEDMTVQFTEALPFVKFDEASRDLTINPNANREEELVKFYDHFISEDLEYFAISEKYAPGLHRLLEILGNNPAHQKDRFFVKGQIIGPITFAASIKGTDGKAILHDTEIMEAMTNGICIKALWQIRTLAGTGRRPILFLDEPYLSGFGSAFSSVSREKVIEVLGNTIRFLKDRAEVLVGIHCCGNTDWSMLLEAGPDIINFDAYGYMDYFLLYSSDIKKFLEKGGYIAWGIVPTSQFSGEEKVEDLQSKLNEGMDRLVRAGIDSDMLYTLSMLTPACGMGTMSPRSASLASHILSQLSRRLRKETG